MRIGVMVGGGQDLDSLVARTQEAQGFANLWMPNIFDLDAITSLSVVGRETTSIELGTAVVPSYPRHPVAMAQQALTAQAASHGRFVLGIGLSHKVVIEGMFGLSFKRPARHMRDYLGALTPLLRGERVKYRGESYRVNAGFEVPGATPVPLLLAAMGERMLDLAGAHADGTSLWMTGPKTIERHIGPRLRQAAMRAGRGDPRIVAAFPIALTHDPVGARARVSANLSGYGTLPSYRAMLDREGVEGPGDLAILGDEHALNAALDRLRDIGVTDFSASIMPVDPDAEGRTLAYLLSRLGGE